MRGHPHFWLLMSVLLLAVLALVAAGVLYNQGYLVTSFPQDAMGFAPLIRSWGGWGVAGSIGLMTLHSFVPFPAEALAVANGIVYGVFWGSVITWTGAMLGAFLAFGATRFFGRPFVKRMLSEKHWQKLETWSLQIGWRTLLMVRFIPVISFNLINYAAGLTRVSVWTFAWTSALGILPLTIFCVWMGDQLSEHSYWLWVLLLVVIILGWGLSAWSDRSQNKQGG